VTAGPPAYQLDNSSRAVAQDGPFSKLDQRLQEIQQQLLRMESLQHQLLAISQSIAGQISSLQSSSFDSSQVQAEKLVPTLIPFPLDEAEGEHDLAPDVGITWLSENTGREEDFLHAIQVSLPTRIDIVDGSYAWIDSVCTAAASSQAVKRMRCAAKADDPAIYRGNALQQLIRKNRLQCLTLAAFRLSEEGWRRLAGALRDAPSLVELKLDGLSLSSTAMRMLADALNHNPGLKTLNLHLPNLSCTRHMSLELAELMRHNKTLESLTMNFESIGINRSVNLLMGLRRNQTLKHLGVTAPNHIWNAVEIGALTGTIGLNPQLASIDVIELRINLAAARALVAFLESNPIQWASADVRLTCAKDQQVEGKEILERLFALHQKRQ
jgi:hypothetical protein